MIRIPQSRYAKSDAPLDQQLANSDPANSDPSLMQNVVPETSSPASHELRYGSPFATQSDAGTAPMPASSTDGDWSTATPAAYTARGALLASLLVIPFAVAGASWFPSGGLLVSGLGTALALFGLRSGRTPVAATLILLHLALFFVSVRASSNA